MVKLPRVKPKVLGIPISRKTVKDLNQAAKDVFMRRFTPEDVKVIRMESGVVISLIYEHRQRWSSLLRIINHPSTKQSGHSSYYLH